MPEALFYLLFNIFKFFRIKKFNDAYIKSVTYLFYSNDSGVFALSVQNAFYRGLRYPRLITERVWRDLVFPTKLIDPKDNEFIYAHTTPRNIISMF